MFDKLGSDWLVDEVEGMDSVIERVGPVEFNEKNRYLPQGVTPRPGYIRYDLFPFLREIIECFDPLSPVREANLMKGVQVGYTTLLESILFYYMFQIKTQPAMFLTADKELASGRVENNILPMINESGFSHLIRSSDEGNDRKTGKTKDYLQWDGGGFLIYNGAVNAAKMRQYSVPLMLKDELDGWKSYVGNDGSSDKLTDARLSAYWELRKILRGSTPLLDPSMISAAYNLGDKRKYLVLCQACSFPQDLRREHVDQETGQVGGFRWETEGGVLVNDSVRYCCKNCGHEHYEHDKEKLFATESGAHWSPTAVAKVADVRSYHLPAWYSPYRFRPWYKGISDYLESFDTETGKVKDIAKMQEYYNNTLGIPFKGFGYKVKLEAVSRHMRDAYRFGDVPNVYAERWSGSKILFLTCLVDVQKENLAVSVMGWTEYKRCYIINYWRFEVKDGEEDDCSELSSPVWGRLRDLIEDKIYEADDGQRYNILLTLVDAGYSNKTVCSFCEDYVSGVYPILGRDRTAKAQTIKEFAEFKTQIGTVGYRILVDYYKDIMATTLKREWVEENGVQAAQHFNAPSDITPKQLKELTVETRKNKTDDRGNVSSAWVRTAGADNELWDLLGYGYAAVDIIAWNICIKTFELDNVVWGDFWEYAKDQENDAIFGRLKKL